MSLLFPAATAQGLSFSWHAPEDPAMHEGALFWYEEENVEDDEDFTEITYESECPTENDILLGTLPPAPPLAEPSDLKPVNASEEQRLLETLREKRDGPNKSTVPGTERGQPLPKQKLPPQPQIQKRGTVVHQFSPTGVWDLCHANKYEANNGKAHISPYRRQYTAFSSSSFSSLPRLQALDAILWRSHQRRAFQLQSNDPRQQIASLQKFWKERIDFQMESIEKQLMPLEKEIMTAEKELALVRRHRMQQQQSR